jgi:hypothetical protein
MDIPALKNRFDFHLLLSQHKLFGKYVEIGVAREIFQSIFATPFLLKNYF